MNKNLAIGLGVVIVVIIAALGITAYNGAMKDSQNATSTPQSVNPPQTQTPPTSPQAAAPIVTTDQNPTPSNSTAVMTGKVTPNGAQTSYWYEYGKTNALGTKTNTQGIGSGYAQINAPGYITGLSANTTYYYRLSAKNSLGTVNGTTYSFATNNNPPPVVKAPTARTDAAVGIDRDNATLKGSVNPGSTDTSYWFEYGRTDDLGNTTAFQSAGNGSIAVAASAAISNLQPLTKYFYRLNAQNRFGTVSGAILNFTTQGPAASSAPSADTNAATAISSSTVTLNGRVNPNGDRTIYWFEYGTDSLLGTILGSNNRAEVAGSGRAEVAVSYNVNGLNPDTRYFYRLVAQNSNGTVRGDIANFTTSQ
jgi:phosphodiesterase/alkaline phosphatase D-like protein